jgi:hypothetical protein
VININMALATLPAGIITSADNRRQDEMNLVGTIANSSMNVL